MIPKSPLRRLLFVTSLALASTFALARSASDAQPSDWHLSPSGAKAFFTRSCFAHGYMHGYEEGFHQGDLDLQIGHEYQGYKEQLSFKKIRGYRREFGDHTSFEMGYQKGYAVGYIDAYAGRSFRAIQLVEEAKGDPQTASPQVPDRRFDEVFLEGYELGRKAGLEDGRAANPVLAVGPKNCGQASPGEDAEYCGAFQRGYRLGYSDGLANQRESAPVFAKK